MCDYLSPHGGNSKLITISSQIRSDNRKARFFWYIRTYRHHGRGTSPELGRNANATQKRRRVIQTDEGDEQSTERCSGYRNVKNRPRNADVQLFISFLFCSFAFHLHLHWARCQDQERSARDLSDKQPDFSPSSLDLPDQTCP